MLVWVIAAVATFGVIVRPFKLPEAVWAVAGALALCASGLLPWQEAGHAIGKGTDVYLFLAGMMIASELARKEGLFDYLAALAARHAKGSPKRLFLLIYLVGVVVTVFMSNDATAVVLTPAVLAVTRTLKIEKPLPYLYICAFVANAASFVLPISNPANLVIFGDQMPGLLEWLKRFSLPSLVAIVVTYVALYWRVKAQLPRTIGSDIAVPDLSGAGKLTGWGILGMAITMLTASALEMDLGFPTFIAGVVMFFAICLRNRRLLAGHLAEISWSVMPLVAGLFVLVEGLQATGVITSLSRYLGNADLQSSSYAAWSAGVTMAFGSNLINNLPAGLIAGSVVAGAEVSTEVVSAILIGIDLGPNLSVTGSLATILWLNALKREDMEVKAWSFHKLGYVVMIPALTLSLCILLKLA